MSSWFLTISSVPWSFTLCLIIHLDVKMTRSVSPSPTISSGLKRRSNLEFLSEAGTLLTSTFLMALMMELNHQVGLLALHNTSIPRYPPPEILFLYLPHTREIQELPLQSAWTFVFSSHLTATSAVSLLHSLWSLRSIKSHILRKYHQVNEFLLTLSCILTPLIKQP